MLVQPRSHFANELTPDSSLLYVMYAYTPSASSTTPIDRAIGPREVLTLGSCLSLQDISDLKPGHYKTGRRLAALSLQDISDLKPGHYKTGRRLRLCGTHARSP